MVLLAGLGPAAAASWTVPPARIDLGDTALEVGGAAGGALFNANDHQNQHASGILKLMPRLHRDFDSGLSLGLDATVTASDVLSRGRYGGDVLEKAYGDIRTGLGRVEIGQTDGAAYDLSVSGPKVDGQVSLDDPQTTFFRDPSTGHAFTDNFTLRTAIGASSNYAKIAYVSPSLFGAQLAVSFTPSQGKEVLPFLQEGPHVAGRQADIWEGAIQYSDALGPVSLSAYGGVAVGRAEHKAPGQEGVSDLGAGLRADYPVNDDLTLSLGGAWRQSNAYAFQIARSYQAATTTARQASAAATYDDWMLGLEYGDGDAGAVASAGSSAPHLGLTGYEAVLGYSFSNSIQPSLGWQHLAYQRSSGIFYNGAPRIGLDAVFLHLNLKTSG
jgi:predicted porin